jgi:hypothetical protein
MSSLSRHDIFSVYAMFFEVLLGDTGGIDNAQIIRTNGWGQFMNRNASAFPDHSAAGLASKLKTDDIPYGEDFPSAMRRGASIHFITG